MNIELYNYIQEIKKYQRFNKEEQNNLLIEIQKGNKEAFLKLFHSNLYLVISIAKKFFKLNISLSKMDIIQEGNLGLLEAINKYNLKYLDYYNFTSYAYNWIRAYIIRAIYDKGYTIRIPINKHQELKLYKDCLYELLNKLGRIPTIKELASALNMTNENVIELSQLENKISIISLNNNLYQDDDKDYYYLLNEENQDILDNIIIKEEKKEIDELINNLPTHRQDIIKLRYGFNDNNPKGFQEVANILKYKDRRYVYEIEKKTLKKLKKEILKKEEVKKNGI